MTSVLESRDLLSRKWSSHFVLGVGRGSLVVELCSYNCSLHALSLGLLHQAFLTFSQPCVFSSPPLMSVYPLTLFSRGTVPGTSNVSASPHLVTQNSSFFSDLVLLKSVKADVSLFHSPNVVVSSFLFVLENLCAPLFLYYNLRK